MSIAHKIIALAKEKKLKIATVESFTGGLIASSLVSISGSSDVFYGGFVVNCHEAKQVFQNIPKSEIEGEKVYSEKTAKMMAEKILQKTKTDIAISTTGVAGPTGGSGKNPIGTAFIGLAQKSKKTLTFKFIFSGSRNQIRKEATKKALEIILGSLKDR